MEEELEQVNTLPDSYEELLKLLKNCFLVPNIISEISRIYKKPETRKNENFRMIKLIILRTNYSGFQIILASIICNEWIDLMQYLYENLAFEDFCDFEEPFFAAFEQGKVRSAEFLVNLLNSKKVTIPQYYIERLFKAAIHNDCLDIVLLLFNYIDPNCRLDKYRNTPLMVALLKNSYNCAIFLADYFDPSLQNNFGETTLILVSKMNLVFEEFDYDINFEEIRENIFIKILNKSQNYIDTEDNLGNTARILSSDNFSEYFNIK